MSALEAFFAEVAAANVRDCRCPNTGHASGVRHFADCPCATPVPAEWKRYGS